MALEEVARSEVTTMAEVIAPTGAVTKVQFLNPDTGEYQDTAPSLLTDQATAIGATAENTGTVRQMLQLVFDVTSPDEVKTRFTGKVNTVEPGQSFDDTTPAINLTIAGTWKAEVLLMSGDAVVISSGVLTMAEVTNRPPTMGETMGQVMGLAMMAMMASSVMRISGGKKSTVSGRTA